jgi:hypothetical protein
VAAVAVVLAVMVLGGCLDVVQYVSGSDGNVDVYLRLTLQKSVFELANSMGDDPQDLDQMFEDEFQLNEDEVVGELPPGVKADFKRVNSDYEFGFELRYSAPREVLAEVPDSDSAFVPRIDRRSMTIPLGDAGNEGGGGGDEFANAFLGSSKYRLLVSKRFVSRISVARLYTGDDSIELPVTDLPDVWMIEFPTSEWINAEEPPSLEVIF